MSAKCQVETSHALCAYQLARVAFALASLREASRVPVFGATLVPAEQGNIHELSIEKSRETVEQLLARRNLPKTYEEKCQYALDLVDMHLHEENPDRIDECIKLYTGGCRLGDARSQR